MQIRKDRWQYMISAVLIAVLALVMIGIIPPCAAQAANFGGLSDNGTAAFMGIGAAPHATRPLYVFGNVPLFERAQDSAGFIIQRTEVNRWVLGVNDNPVKGKGFVISTYPIGSLGSTARFLVTPEGRIGINTVAPDPASKLNVLNDNQTYPNLAVYGQTTGGYTYGVGGTNDALQSMGFAGGSYNQSGTNYGIGAYGTNIAYGKSGSLGTPNEGVYGYNGGSGYAGYFQGNVHVAGTFTSSNKLFRIDHPLDPANKYLQHSVIESPDMMNIYNGNIVLDGQGKAVVELPAYFEALNKDFRYQLTCIGAKALVWVDQEIAGNSFTIAGDTPGVKVSWQVTGIRHDTWAEANPIQVELEKANTKANSPALQPAGGKMGWSDWSNRPPAMSQ